MPRPDYAESLILAEWAERECQHRDLIASWETLLAVYEALGFTDRIDDDRRLEEFKTIISETNKFLTRMKNGLSNTTNIDSAIEFLSSHMDTKDMSLIKSRSSVAYNKFKQSWIQQSIAILATARETQEGERDG